MLFLIRKMIPLAIIDEESYEKSLIMYVNIGEPRHIAGKIDFFYLIFVDRGGLSCGKKFFLMSFEAKVFFFL
jgi:hypothetical protein